MCFVFEEMKRGTEKRKLIGAMIDLRYFKRKADNFGFFDF